MKVSAISANNVTNFGGVHKITSQLSDATVTKYISPKGKEVGFHIVAKNGNIAGMRRYSDGLSVSYNITNLPVYGTPSYATILISNTKPSRFKNGLTNAKFNISTDYFLKNKDTLITKKGIINFINEQEKIWEAVKKLGAAEEIIF